jgi:hypothetical protein
MVWGADKTGATAAVMRMTEKAVEERIVWMKLIDN